MPGSKAPHNTKGRRVVESIRQRLINLLGKTSASLYHLDNMLTTPGGKQLTVEQLEHLDDILCMIEARDKHGS